MDEDYFDYEEQKLYGYNDRNRLTEIPAAVLYLHLSALFHFRDADLPRLAYFPPRHLDADWRFRRPSRGPAVIRPDNIGRRVTILRIPGTHQIDPRWSCDDPEFAFGLPEETDRRLTQALMRVLDDENKSTIKEYSYDA